MSLFQDTIEQIIHTAAQMAKTLSTLPIDDQVEALNRIRIILHEAGPFASEPVDRVLWVKNKTIKPNDYNPNNVAPPEMRLLNHSIDENGFAFPVAAWNKDVASPNGRDLTAVLRPNATNVVVDGEHRSRVGKQKKYKERMHGYTPIAVIKTDRSDEAALIAATIEFNRARGVHAVVPMKEIVEKLLRLGWTDDRIAKELGMDADEVLRYKQIAGVAHLYRNEPYSRAWE